MRERFLHWTYQVVRHHAWWVLISSIILSILALIYTFFISDFGMRSSLIDLLPQGDPLIKRFEESKVALEWTDYLSILLSLKSPPSAEGERLSHLKGVADGLIAELKRNKEIVEASYRPDMAIPEVGLLSIGNEKLKELVERSERIQKGLASPQLKLEGKERLAAVYREINKSIEEAFLSGSTADEEVEVKPLQPQVDSELLTEELGKLEQLTTGVKHLLESLSQSDQIKGDIDGLLASLTEIEAETSQKIFLSPDKSAILINVRPRLPSQESLSYNRKITQVVRGTIEAAGLDPQEFAVGLAGSYVFAAESDQFIRRDMRNTTIISSLGVALIFVLIFGRVFYPLLATIPLFMAMIITMAWAKLAVGGLNLVTSFLPALIMGLGIDYGVHFIARYIEERNCGQSISKALETTILRKGSATLTAALTTAFVFFSLMLARSRGIYEMGVIAGVGVLLSFILTLFALPSLIIVSHLTLKRAFKEEPPRYRINLERVIQWIITRKKEVLIGSLILSLLILYPATRVQFEFASENLVPEGMESQLTQASIQHLGIELGTTQLGGVFVFFAKSEEELTHQLNQLNNVDLVKSVSSLADFLGPGMEEREEALSGMNIGDVVAQGERGMTVVQNNLEDGPQIIEQAEELIGNLSSLQLISTLYGQGPLSVMVNALRQGLVELMDHLERLDSSVITENIEDLRGRLSLLKARLKGMFGSTSEDPLARAISTLREKFKAPGGEFIIYALVSNKVYQKEYYKRFIAAVSEISDDYFGYPMIQDRLEKHMEKDFLVTTLLAAILIIFLLRSSFRRREAFKGASFLAALPLILGYIWMLGSMRLLGIQFNFTNILISPLLIGIGVDNGVHILHRYLEEKSLEKSVSSTAVAILATSLTTMLVFGSLLFARTPGLRILGQSALLGIGFTTIFSLSLIPAIISFRRTSSKD